MSSIIVMTALFRELCDGVAMISQHCLTLSLKHFMTLEYQNIISTCLHSSAAQASAVIPQSCIDDCGPGMSELCISVHFSSACFSCACVHVHEQQQSGGAQQEQELS